MMIELILELMKKEVKVFFSLRNKQIYTGKIIDVSEDKNGVFFITIIDKFNQKVMFVNSEIEILREEKWFGGWKTMKE